MSTREFFPLGIAEGKAFCNRVDETQLLLNNILSHKHTLLMAPRRYGKSSLAERAITMSHYPSVEVDFYMARNEQVIEAYIINGVIELIGKALGSVDKLIASIKKYAKKLIPKLNIGGSVMRLELSVEVDSDPATNVKEALMLVENLLAEKETSAVMLFDEFQNVGVITKGMGVEGAIRHVAQRTKYLTLIFSGSNRKLLATMFEDDTRPLYKLCWKQTLSRISSDHYRNHIMKIAKLAWGHTLSEQAFEEMMQLTERHPYYVNKLGDRMLAYCDKPPSAKKVFQIWQQLLAEEKSDAIKEISLSSLGQKQVLLQIAKGQRDNLTSKQTILQLKMTSSSITSALDALDEKDVIEKTAAGYQIINPVVRYYVLLGKV